MRPFTTNGILLIGLLCGGGCGSHQSGDDHRLEHVTPAHKPKSFTDAVKVLRSRRPSIMGSSQQLTLQRQEYLDIIRWLPELAAETNLKKREWEVVLSISKKLEAKVQSASSTNLATPNDQQSVDELIDSLNPLLYVSSPVGGATHEPR